jgi:hypothetical protein
LEQRDESPDSDLEALARMNQAPIVRQPVPPRNAEYESAMSTARSMEDVMRVAEQFGRVQHFE